MRFLLTFIITCHFFSNLRGVEHLPDQYLVSYGSSDATTKIVEYFSFLCPHCLSLFKSDFEKVKSDFIDTGKVQFIFHPFPRDLTTTQAMICLSKLDNQDKQIFLEVLFEKIHLDDPKTIAKCMIASMELLNHPIPLLDNPGFLKEQEALKDSFQFLTQKEKIIALPSVEIHGVYYPDELPDHKFITKVLERKS